jgi:penicillin-binding protein 1A
MSRALKDVPIQLPEAPEGLVAFGEGRDRSYIYAENAAKERPADETAQDGAPLPKPDLSVLPSD